MTDPGSPPPDSAPPNSSQPNSTGRRGFSRRLFLKSAPLAAAGTALSPAAAAEAARTAASRSLIRADETVTLELAVNGSKQQVEVETRTTLLDALRDRADMTGTKKVCDRGACGACTVLMDGQPVNSCLTLALDAAGRDIQTIEGLSNGEQLHPVQEAFVECDALQCGFCTPGFVMSSGACLRKHGTPGREQVAHELSGNICRCGTYPRIFEAVEQAAGNGGGK